MYFPKGVIGMTDFNNSNMKKKIKVNMHLTEKCNYDCRYCFAHFGEHMKLKKEDWMKIIDNCADSGSVYEINFAGGEPMLLPYLHELAEYVNKKGMSCSLITNGSMLTEKWIKKYAGLFRTIGISVDSFSAETARETGRCTCRGEVQSAERTADSIRKIKYWHPEVKIKMNTVVNRLNRNEIPAIFMESENLRIDRWKLLKMAYFNDGCHNNAELTVTDDEYNNFVKNNLRVFGVSDISDDKVRYETECGTEVVAEKEIKGGYYMIDAGGYLVDDTYNDSYTRVINCLTEPLNEGIDKLTLYEDVYYSRYKEV